MYIPPYFAETRPDEVARLLAEHPLGALVTHGPSGLDATHLPFEHDVEAGVLRAHVARGNPVWQGVAAEGCPALVIFGGGSAYVSPNWYPSKHATHRQVPTWNYQVVHMHGTLHVRDDERFLRGLLARLTRHHEQQAGEAKPWRMGDAPPDYLDQLLAAIVGIEIRITHIEAVSKLNQNKDAADRAGVTAALTALGADEMVQAMARADVPGKV